MQTEANRQDPNGEPRSDTQVSWTSRIHLLTNPFVWWDTARVLVIALLALELLVALTGFLVDGEVAFIPLKVWLIPLAILAVLFALAMLIMRNRVWARFSLDSKRARYESVPEMDGYERTVNRVVKVLLFLLSGWRGLTAQVFGGGSADDIAWSDVHKVTVHRKTRVVTLNNSWRSVIRLYCLPDNFDRVVTFVQARAAEGAAKRARRAPDRVARPVWLYFAWTVLSLAAVVGCNAWTWAEDRGAGRIGLVAGILTLIVGLTSAFWWSKLLALAAIACDMVFFVLLAMSALETFRPFGGGAPVRTLTLDTPLLVVSAVSGLVLLALGVARWRLSDAHRKKERKAAR